LVELFAKMVQKNSRDHLISVDSIHMCLSAGVGNYFSARRTLHYLGLERMTYPWWPKHTAKA